MRSGPETGTSAMDPAGGPLMERERTGQVVGMTGG